MKNITLESRHDRCSSLERISKSTLAQKYITSQAAIFREQNNISVKEFNRKHIKDAYSNLIDPEIVTNIRKFSEYIQKNFDISFRLSYIDFYSEQKVTWKDVEVAWKNQLVNNIWIHKELEPILLTIYNYHNKIMNNIAHIGSEPVISENTLEQKLEYITFDELFYIFESNDGKSKNKKVAYLCSIFSVSINNTKWAKLFNNMLGFKKWDKLNEEWKRKISSHIKGSLNWIYSTSSTQTRERIQQWLNKK